MRRCTRNNSNNPRDTAPADLLTDIYLPLLVIARARSMPKTLTEKFNSQQTHQVKPVPIDIAGMKKGEIMLIPTPKIIDAFIASILWEHQHGREDAANKACEKLTRPRRRA